MANQVMTARRAIHALLVFDVRLKTACAVRHWIRYAYSLNIHHAWPLCQGGLGESGSIAKPHRQ
ncbi:hypothetical protein U2G91_01325 [Rhodococcoides fascians]|uniref:hypothetical protein n=1 Tax=Rhodococcoides fascians TaxID=1828 RepID=UPI002ACE013E|nr:hypothetical protein [Rhodococcus fascians]WQH28653.1 hypothetical protein U2G91_01325 [Rhodococcus fascians]